VREVTLPYLAARKVRCPSCASLSTEYHPASRRGLCHDCGLAWRLHPPAHPQADPDHRLSLGGSYALGDPEDPSGFVTACRCGWRSAVCDDLNSAVDTWARHFGLKGASA
jgi:hypothetical protein